MFDIEDQADLFKVLRESPEGDEMKALMKQILWDEDLLWEIHDRVIKDLKSVFDNILQSYDIQTFGSTVNGLALKDSDFDIFVSVHDINLNDLNDVKKLIQSLHAEFLKYSNLFSQSEPIYLAKVPLLKLTHTSTGFLLDINFSNCYGVYNSIILKKLLKFDNRIYPLVVLLKYWAKLNKVTGAGKIPNYTFVLMIIFVLQTLNEPILPPIQTFQNDISELMVNNYNFSFNDNIPNTTKNTMSLFELLKEFFNFYSRFKYNENFICPYMGKVIKRSDFNNLFKIESTLFDFNKKICVQDPFEHNCNKITNNNKRNNQLFIRLLRASKRILVKNELLKSSEILIKLLSISLAEINGKEN